MNKMVLIALFVLFQFNVCTAQSTKIINAYLVGTWTTYEGWKPIGEAECGALECETIPETGKLIDAIALSYAFIEANFSLVPSDSTKSVCADSCANSLDCAKVKGFYNIRKVSTKIHEEVQQWYPLEPQNPPTCHSVFNDAVYVEETVIATQKSFQFCPDKPTTWPDCVQPKCPDENPKNTDPCEIKDADPCRHEASDNPKVDDDGPCPYPRVGTPTPEENEQEPSCPYSHSGSVC